jgi:hypothetical protein
MSTFLSDLAADLRSDAAKAKPKKRPASSSLRQFLEDDVATDNGPWSIDDHEPFAEILALIDEVVRKRRVDVEISLLKAEQIGATTSLGLGPALQLVSDLGRNVGYFGPTKDWANEIGRTRLKAIIAKSAYLSARLKDGESVNRSTVKEFDGKFLYMLGLESMLGAITKPLDALLNDEVDLLPLENLEWQHGRVAHSNLRLRLFFSAGYSPGAGIDLRFQEGTQHKWRVDCANRKCRKKGICLEEHFPACMVEEKGAWRRACPECGTHINAKAGRWVATFPERAKQGKYSFRISALSITAISGEYIMNRWRKCRTKSQKAKFNCSVLAIPDAGAMQPIGDVELNKMQSGELKGLRYSRSELPRFAGIDAGDIYHFAAYERRPNGDPHLIWAEEIDSDVVIERVSTLIGSLGVAQLVADKKPHTNTVRALAYRFPQIVALQDFKDNSPLKVEEEEHAGRKYRCVKIDRDDSLDEMTGDFVGEHFLRIPDIDKPESDPVLAIFATHCKNLRKERSIDSKGRIVDKYVKGVANHFGMALNSARIAETIAPVYMPFSYEPAGSNHATGIREAYC